MTEAEWLACTNPQRMLFFLRGRASDRKLRLFACAYCRLQWNLLTDERSRKAVEMAEEYADGLVSEAECREAAGAALAVDQTNLPELYAYAATAAWYTIYYKAEVAAGTTCDADAMEWYAEHEKEMPHPMLLREVFGNPFRPVVVDSAWQTAGVISLAEEIYRARAFERMPMLAVALEQAGCDSQEMLNHCREVREHFVGCWVIDLLLGKGAA